MSSVKLILMISTFSFANFLFADDMEVLKKRLEEIATLHPADLNVVLPAKTGEIEAAVNAINQAAFGPTSKELDEAAKQLTTHSFFLAEFSRKINEKKADMTHEKAKLAQIIGLLKEEKGELEKSTFIVTARKEIKARLLALYNKFQVLAQNLSTMADMR